jgi:hypothetical protein
VRGEWGRSTDAQRINGCALGVSSGNITMILEVAILNIRPDASADFERALAEAQAIKTSQVLTNWRARLASQLDRSSVIA